MTGDLERAFALANAFKEGDLVVGGTTDDLIREDARRTLRAATLGDIRRVVFVDDAVTDALARFLDRRTAADLDSWTIGDLCQRLHRPDAAAWLDRHRNALTSEAIAACAKVLSDDELASICGRIFNPPKGDGGAAVGVGTSRHFGSRVQPNSAGDDEEEILFSVLEGLSYGCGDVVLGLNPASDDVETIVRLEELLERIAGRLELPTRTCVLSDIVKQHRAQQRTRVDLGFQSLAGTSRALAGMVGLDVDGILDLARSFRGLYFETGQGSEVTNGTADGLDMVTLEARTYGVARYLATQAGTWTIVNDVAGFIGPEVFSSAAQLERACIEDCFMAKVHGLTMGLDVCATFHMGIPPAELRAVTARVVHRAAPAYLMAVAGNADPMLGYLTTSFREHPQLRNATGRRMASAFEARLRELGVVDGSGNPTPGDRATAALYATYAKAGGDRRTMEALAGEGLARLRALRERGWDLGMGCAEGFTAPAACDLRVETLYRHARGALYATLDPLVLRDAAPSHRRARTCATDRDEYLARPATGERLRDADADALAALARADRARVRLVISDGLNANALNENLRALLPPLRRQLQEADCAIGTPAVVIENGRVRAGYHAGQVMDAELLVHLIGERPGTGLNTLSAYVTYGRDRQGRPRLAPALDHACTTAICGIHPAGLAPERAASEIARVAARALADRRSGVEGV